MSKSKNSKEQVSIFDLLAANKTGDIGESFSPDQIQELINTLNTAKKSAAKRERNERIRIEREARERKEREERKRLSHR